MPEHHDLELLELLRTAAQQHELHQAAQRQVPERPEQEQLLEISRAGARLYGRAETSNPRAELTQPTGADGETVLPLPPGDWRARWSGFGQAGAEAREYAEQWQED